MSISLFFVFDYSTYHFGINLRSGTYNQMLPTYSKQYKNPIFWFIKNDPENYLHISVC